MQFSISEMILKIFLFFFYIFFLTNIVNFSLFLVCQCVQVVACLHAFNFNKQTKILYIIWTLGKIQKIEKKLSQPVPPFGSLHIVNFRCNMLLLYTKNLVGLYLQLSLYIHIYKRFAFQILCLNKFQNYCLNLQ